MFPYLRRDDFSECAAFGQLRKGFAPPGSSRCFKRTLFGLFHGLTVHIGYAFVCGLIIASCYYLTDSLFAPVLLHMVFNIIGSGLPTFLSLEFLGIPDEKTIPFMMGLNTVCIIFMPVAVFALSISSALSANSPNRLLQILKSSQCLLQKILRTLQILCLQIPMKYPAFPELMKVGKQHEETCPPDIRNNQEKEIWRNPGRYCCHSCNCCNSSRLCRSFRLGSELCEIAATPDKAGDTFGGTGINCDLIPNINLIRDASFESSTGYSSMLVAGADENSIFLTPDAVASAGYDTAECTGDTARIISIDSDGVMSEKFTGTVTGFKPARLGVVTLIKDSKDLWDEDRIEEMAFYGNTAVALTSSGRLIYDVTNSQLAEVVDTSERIFADRFKCERDCCSICKRSIYFSQDGKNLVLMYEP